MKKTITLLLALSLGILAGADNSRYVNLFMGTAGDHGQVSPAAQLPFGLASVGPDCQTLTHSGYDYDDPVIRGFSVTRVSGVGGDGGGGNLRIFPAMPDKTLRIVKDKEKAVPGYYETMLDDGTRVRLTATPHCAIEQYRFGPEAERVLYVDFNSAIDPRRSDCFYQCITRDSTRCRILRGWVESSTVCNRGKYRLYFQLKTNADFSIEARDRTTALLRFDPGVKQVEVRIGLSSIDVEASGREEEAIMKRRFGALRKDAAHAWREILGKADVRGSSKEQRILFYTSLYRVCLSPFHATFGGKYRGTDGAVHEADGWTFYSGWSMWDTFRTKFPLLCLFEPELSSDIGRSLVSLYRTGKRNWATMEEPVPTVRTEHSQVTLLDAWSKGIRGFDLSEAWPAMEAEADAGRVPGARDGLTRNSPDQLMETVYDLWAMGEIAGIIGDADAQARYGAEADSLFEATWKREFMTIDSTYALMRGNGMYQGTRWQYRWAMPVFADKMSAWAGRDVLADQLEEFFARHLFNQGNEPDIQTPFLFPLFGRPEKTDSLVHALLTDEGMIHLYGGNAEYPEPFVGRAFRNAVDGYAPEMDEDDGTMSAWYMFAQMGLYPVCVGTDRYVLFSPLFKRVTLHLKDHDVTLVRRGRDDRTGRITVDGRPLEGRTLTHEALTSARRIRYD